MGAAFVLVAVSGRSGPMRVLRDDPRDARIVTTGFGRLREALERHRPSHVIARAVSPDLDALDLAQALDASGFEGRLVIMGCDLPCIALVREEVARAFPSLRLDVLRSGPAPRASAA
jgi:hypothetical protein